ncbi:MAG: DUF3857 domain-containing protein [Verrucomicrobiae bacterium]|nr:DUF3857 domain-containing protein [Verrucomicrobiae bacterium]
MIGGRYLLRFLVLASIAVLGRAQDAHVAEKGTAAAGAITNGADNSPQWEVTKTPAWVDVREDLPTAESAAGGQSGGVAYLVFDNQVHVGTSEEYRRVAIRIRNEAGLRQASQLSFSFDPAYQRLGLHFVRIRRDNRAYDRLDPGRVRLLQRESEIDRYMVNGETTALLILDDVRIGDIIEYAFTTRGRNPVFQGRFADTVMLGWPTPLGRFNYRLVVPAGRSVAFRTHGIDWPAKTATTARGTEHVWMRDAIPATHFDADAPAWFMPLPWLQVSEFGSWAEVAQWAWRNFTIASDHGEDRASIELPFDSATAPIERILHFVQDDVRYLALAMGSASHRPYPPQTVALRRFGDCKDKSLLLCALLRARGIEAHPVLVNSQRRGEVADQLPSPLSFDHVVVRARLEGRECWIDATSGSQGGAITARAVAPFGCGLVVSESSTGLVPIPPSAVSGRMTVVETYDALVLSGPVRLSVRTEFSGQSADRMRAAVASSGHDELRRSVSQFYTRQFSGIRPSLSVDVEDDREANRLLMKEDYEIDGFWATNSASGMLQASVGAVCVAESLPLPTGPLRHSPLALPHPSELAFTSHVRLAPEFRMPPDDQRLENKWFRFESRRRFVTNVLSYSCFLTTLSDHVPADRIQEYSESVNRVRQSLGFVFTKDPKANRSVSHWNLQALSGWVYPALGIFAVACLASIGLYFFDPRGWRLSHTVGDRSLDGIAGLLALFAVGLIVTPLFYMLSAFKNIWLASGPALAGMLDSAAAGYQPRIAHLCFAEFAYCVAMVPISVLLLVAFFQKRTLFPPLVLCVMAAGMCFSWTDSWLARDLPRSGNQALPFFTQALVTSICSLVLGGYFILSRRVMNTFRKRRTFAEGHSSMSAAPLRKPPILPPQPMHAERPAPRVDVGDADAPLPEARNALPPTIRLP